MTDRGLPSVDSAQACPFVAFEHDRDERATSPDHRHRCYAEARPAPRAIAHQEAYCLSSAFPVCPTFQDWARREAARARGAGVGAATAGAGVAAAAVSPTRDALRGNAGAWPQPAPFAGRDVGRSPIEPDDDRDDPGDVDDGEADEDRYDRGAPVFPPGRAEPGSGLAGSRADRVAMAGGAADPEGARPAWPAADDLSAGRRGGADDWPSAGRIGAAGALGAAGAAGAGAGGAGGAGRYPGSYPAGRDTDWEPDFDDRGRDPSDYPHRDERLEPADGGGRRGLFGRGGDKRPKVGDTRRGRNEDEAPPWERPRRNEAYPTVKTRSRMGGLSRVLLAAVLLFGAAIAVFFLPQLLINKPTTPAAGGASPTPSTAAVASASLPPTPEPSPTPFTYTVVPKDTLTKIARKFGLTVDQILAANPAITDANVLKIGDKLVIPTPAPSGSSSTAPSAAP